MAKSRLAKLLDKLAETKEGSDEYKAVTKQIVDEHLAMQKRREELAKQKEEDDKLKLGEPKKIKFILCDNCKAEVVKQKKASKKLIKKVAQEKK